MGFFSYKSNEWSDHPLLILWFSAVGLDYKSPMATFSAWQAASLYRAPKGKHLLLPGPICWLFVSDNLTVWLGHINDLLVATERGNLPCTHQDALICLMRQYSCVRPKSTPLITVATLSRWLFKQRSSFQALCGHTLECPLVIYCFPG